MFFVKSAVSGVWRSVDMYDVHGNKYGEKTLIRGHDENKSWCVDGRPVAMEPGLCVSFRDAMDAQWFLEQGRASIITVEAGSIVAFEDEADAQWHVRKGLGTLMSRSEVDALIAAAQAEHEKMMAQHAEAETPTQDAPKAKTRSKKAKG